MVFNEDVANKSLCKDGIHDIVFHSPQRNLKQCKNCTYMDEMTDTECQRNRESFQDPRWMELEGK